MAIDVPLAATGAARPGSWAPGSDTAAGLTLHGDGLQPSSTTVRKPAAVARVRAGAVGWRKGQPRAVSTRIRLMAGAAPGLPAGSVTRPPWWSRLRCTSSRASCWSALIGPLLRGPRGSLASVARQPAEARDPRGSGQASATEPAGAREFPCSDARASRRRSALASSRSRFSRPCSTAATMAAIAASASAGISTRSAPASRASTAASPAPWWAVIASITRASVTTRPPKPRSWRSSPVSTAAERVAGRSRSSSGSSRWAVITLDTPAAIAARKGGNSTASSRLRLRGSRGSSRWESLAQSP